MVEEVAKNIYRIVVPLPNNPLKELNSYLIRSERQELLIDTGFRCKESYAALTAGLEKLGSNSTHRDVLITHVHSDHSGMADLFAGPSRSIYFSETDLTHYRRIFNGELADRQQERFLNEGFPVELLNYIQQHNPATVMAMPEITDAFREIHGGEVLTVGNLRLQMISVPGHTPGNSMFWLEEQGILFSGDHILFDITPNITAWPEMNDALGTYLDSLRRVRALPVRKTLPGHRKTGDYQKRIDELLLHHDVRLLEMLRIIAQNPGLNAYEIAGRMTWRIHARNWEEFPAVQKWFAVGECIAHLDYLRLKKRISCEMVYGLAHYQINNLQ